MSINSGEIITLFEEKYTEVNTRYKELRDEIKRLDYYTLDLLHLTENKTWPANKAAKLKKEEHLMRIYRRKVKDELALLIPIYQVLCQANGQLQAAKRTLAAEEKLQAGPRKYKNRVMKDKLLFIDEVI